MDFLPIQPSYHNLRQHLELESPRIITQIASIAIRHLGGRKQLAISPTEKVIAIVPLLDLFLRIAIPPSLTYYKKS